MGRLIGPWEPPTLAGTKSVEVDVETFAVPDGAVIKLVHAGKWKFIHVKSGGLVFVMSPGLGQLVETKEQRRERGRPFAWAAVEGDLLKAH